MRIGNDRTLRQIADAQPDIETPAGLVENLFRITIRDRTECRAGNERSGQFNSRNHGSATHRDRHATGRKMATCTIPDRHDAVGAADIADDALCADIDGFGQFERWRYRRDIT